MPDLHFAELISKIAHELRSPLTSVKGFSATLVKRWEKFTDEQRLQFVETIHADAERMGRIVSEVLDLARLEAGTLELHQTRVDLVDATTRAVNNVSQLPGAERIVVDIGGGETAWADPERLEHVITNLVENAVKFSEDGPITISTGGSDGATEIAIQDEGVGIPTDRLPEVFSGPAPAGQRSGPSGTGLGLYLTRRLVEAHGGTIEAESTEGEGSTFKVKLPAEPRS